MFYKCVLEKVTSNHENLRTNVIEGVAELPKVGYDFYIFGEGIDYGIRNIHTTEVKELKKISPDTLEFKTRNSTYSLKIKAAIGENRDALNEYLSQVNKGMPEGDITPNLLFVLDDDLIASLMNGDPKH